MEKKIFTLHLTEGEIKTLKRKAEKSGLSVNSLVKNQLISEIQEIPNLYYGNWWDSPTKINEYLERQKVKGGQKK